MINRRVTGREDYHDGKFWRALLTLECGHVVDRKGNPGKIKRRAFCGECE